MAAGAVRDSYFETGLEILAELGFGGLKLAELCRRMGVTTGSFYHYFTGWSAYTTDLISYWRQDRTVRIIEAIRTESEPRRRIEAAIEVALALPHSAEAAIRAWSAVDPDVLRVQTEVDRERFEILYNSALTIVGDPRQAEVYAAWAVFVFVGYEQSTLPRENPVFAWLSTRMLDDLEAGRFTDVPPPPLPASAPQK
ncbi:MAG TPA: TetR/AcrR family transcriptional regulator [Mycobacterium sp.]|nr:MAG: TetR/AcrR family transcriptional regulator [Mycobacterium sp.]HOB50028.1 TetR/AcrR family transcriptional regulator [Mycobacterium sp.]HQE16487.1 TetR/AcrR family transcriptional regulator [Mycobacterium sp.]